MDGPAESIPNSASHEIDRWPWQYREYYGTLAAVVIAHALLVAISLRFLIPELQHHRVASEIRDVKSDPAVAWLNNSATSPSTPSSQSPAGGAQRLPFATGIAPEKDPPSQIALPLPPATPEPTPSPKEAAPPKPQPDPEPAPQPQLAPAANPTPVTPPKEKNRSLPVLSLAPAPTPKPKPEPKPEPKPAVKIASAPEPTPVTPATPKLTPKPVPKPVPKPEPERVLNPAPQPAPVIKPVVVAAPTPPTPPPAQPSLRPVIAVRPEVVAPAPAATATPPSQNPSSGTFGAAPGPGSQGQSDDLSNYHRLIHDTFHRNWRQPTSLPSGTSTYQTKVKIVIARDGTIVGTSFVRASGNPAMDDSVQRAVTTVRRIAPLPLYIESANYSVVINFQLD